MSILPLVSAALLTLPAADAKLEIQDVKAVHGPLGPERKSLDVYPGDALVVRYTVTGVRADAEGKVDVVKTVRLLDAAGKELLKQEQPLKGLLPLGGGRFQDVANLNIGDRVAPGDYTLSVAVKDNLSSQTASFERKVVCKEAAFAIVAPQFFYDADNKITAAAGGFAGQTLFFRLLVIGFDRTRARLEHEMTVQVLDAQKQEMLPKPISAEFKSEDAETIKKAVSLTFRGNLVLNRAGEFTLRITVTDRLAKKSTVFEAPLRVTAP